MDVPITEDEWRGEHGFALLDVMHLSPGEPCQLWIDAPGRAVASLDRGSPWDAAADVVAPRRAGQPQGTLPGWWCDGKVEQPRLRLGGTGTAALDAFDAVPMYHLGIPIEWCGPEELAWCAAEGIRAVAIDPNDPPRYEAKPPICGAIGRSRAARRSGCRRTHSSQKRSASLH